jgi:hypothetical protein
LKGLEGLKCVGISDGWQMIKRKKRKKNLWFEGIKKMESLG